MSPPLQARLQQLEAQLTVARSNLRQLQSTSQERLGVGRAMFVIVAGLMLIAAAPSVSRVKAPFQVLDGAGKPIFEVRGATPGDPSNHNLNLYNDTGTPVVLMASPGKSSFFKVQSASTNTVAVMGQNEGKSPLLSLRTGGPQKNRLTLAVVDGKPVLNMMNAAGNVIVNLTQGELEGGELQLADPQGNEVVGAGIQASGVGVVRTRPLGNAGVNVGKTAIIHGSGLPATFICGKGCSQ